MQGMYVSNNFIIPFAEEYTFYYILWLVLCDLLLCDL